jgi:hypothetical protein
MSANKQTSIVLNVSEWNPSAIKYMAPKTLPSKAKSISMISTQTNRSLHIATPLMMTWGIADFVNENGESDGKFSMPLNFPNAEYATQATTDFLQKLKALEERILDDAVRNSEVWWGKEKSREVLKETFNPMLKYSKNKESNKLDMSKPPSIKAKVPYYNDKWNIEIYDTRGNVLFPSDNTHHTPMDFVPKLSNVACVLQCGGIWMSGLSSWGITWKLVQCVVKPREVVSVYGKCHIQLSEEDRENLDKQPLLDEGVAEELLSSSEPVLPPSKPIVSTPVKVTAPAYLETLAPDSDDEAETTSVAAVPEPEPVEEVAPVAAAVVKKKVVKKKV